MDGERRMKRFLSKLDGLYERFAQRVERDGAVNEELIGALGLLAGMAGFLAARVFGVTHQRGQVALVIVFMVFSLGRIDHDGEGEKAVSVKE